RTTCSRGPELATALRGSDEGLQGHVLSPHPALCSSKCRRQRGQAKSTTLRNFGGHRGLRNRHIQGGIGHLRLLDLPPCGTRRPPEHSLAAHHEPLRTIRRVRVLPARLPDLPPCGTR